MPSYYDTLLRRHAENPILAPGDFPGGNTDAVFNCGQTLHDGMTVLLLSVILRNHPTPRIHVAESRDGLRFHIHPDPFMVQLDHPDLGSLDDWPIDTRVTRIDDAYYIVRPTGGSSHALLFRTVDFRKYEFVDCIALSHNRVPCLFSERIGGYYWKLDRPSVGTPPENRGEIWISRSPDLVHWGHFRPLLRPFTHWAGFKIGPTPPVRTEQGWLEIIHGVERNCSTARYSLGAVLLDLEDPTRIVGRMNSYLLTPETEYEHCGRVPEVVFACGAIADPRQDRLRVYYGAADTCVCLAEGVLSDIVTACLNGA